MWLSPFSLHYTHREARTKEIDWQQMVLLYFAIVVRTTDTQTHFIVLVTMMWECFVRTSCIVCVCVCIEFIYSAMKCAALFVLWLTSGAFDHFFLLLLLLLYTVLFFHYTKSTFTLPHCDVCGLFSQSNLNLFMNRLLLIFERLDSR